MKVLEAVRKRISGVFVEALKYIAQVIVIGTVILAYVFGRYFEDLSVWIVVAILLGMLIIAFVVSVARDVKGKGKDIPIPPYRFTEDNDGELSIRNRDLQPLIVYTHEIERYLDELGISISIPPNTD